MVVGDGNGIPKLEFCRHGYRRLRTSKAEKRLNAAAKRHVSSRQHMWEASIPKQLI